MARRESGHQVSLRSVDHERRANGWKSLEVWVHRWSHGSCCGSLIVRVVRSMCRWHGAWRNGFPEHEHGSNGWRNEARWWRRKDDGTTRHGNADANGNDEHGDERPEFRRSPKQSIRPTNHAEPTSGPCSGHAVAGSVGRAASATDRGTSATVAIEIHRQGWPAAGEFGIAVSESRHRVVKVFRG